MSWTPDIRALVHNVFTFQVEELGWTALSIIAILFVFIYNPHAAGFRSPQAASSLISPSCLALAQRHKAKASAEKKLEQRRRIIRGNLSKRGFRLMCLPPELQLLILSHSADWPETYRALVLVSRYTYHSTLRACLPIMPITLSSTKQLSSFASLVNRKQNSRHWFDRGNLVHNLWISPLQNDDFMLTYHIMRACQSIRVLACDARGLSLITFSHVLKHTLCKDLTLLLSHSQWIHALNRPTGIQFLRQLTHLRVMGEQNLPKTLSFDRLLYLSYPERSYPDLDMGDSVVERPSALSNRSIYPSLRQVVLTRRGFHERPPLLLEPMLVLLRIYRFSTEMELWRTGCQGQGLWQKAAKALPADKHVP